MNAPSFWKRETIARPLRPHQVKAIQMLRQSIGSGKKRVVMCLATGAGKTRLAAEIVLGATSKGNSVCFTVPAISLIDQTVAAFENEGLHDLGVIQANHPRTDYGARVQIASVQTLSRRGFPDTGVVVVDECHLQFEIIKEWQRKRPETIFVGLSATPWAKGMAENWQELLTPITMQELIDQGYLSPFRVFAPSHPDLSGVKMTAGDYNETQLGEVMSDRKLVADVVETWLTKGEGRPTLIFAVNRAHAMHLRDEFEKVGVKMGYCDANTDLIERQFLFDQMKRGALSGIVNIGTLTTGVDADVRCVVMARPTKSEMLFVQCIGRGLRTAPGKADCIILDHADNHERMGFVTDIHHTKLLGGKDKRHLTRKELDEPMPKECPACHTLKAPKVRECPVCHFTPTRQSEVEFEDGELVEITTKAVKPVKYTQEDKQRWYSELRYIAANRGRSKGWAAHCYRDKFGVWPRGMEEDLKPASLEVQHWVKAKDIRFAKARGKAA